MKRRSLLMMGIALLGAASVAQAQTPTPTPTPKLNYKAMDKLGWKLAAQAYTFREMSAFETLDVLQSLGVRYVEFYPGQRFSKERPEARLDHNMSPELMAELKAKLKATKVTPMNYGVVGLPNDEAQSRKVFDWAKQMGIKTIVSEPAEEAVPLIDKLAQEYKINMAIHDHPKPSRYWHPDSVLKVSEGRSKHIGACADTGHWYRSGLVPVECLKQLEGRIISMHFKDLNTAKHDVPWGTGECNARGMLEEIKRQRVKPVISIEYETGSGQELINNVAKCVQWFSDQATELAKKK